MTRHTAPRVYLSPPHMDGEELRLVEGVFRSNWIAPLGPEVDTFEREFATTVGSRSALALASGTAGLHLGLLLVGVGGGDEVLVSDLTFAASVNPILYLGGYPTFIDSERGSWNMDSTLLSETLDRRARSGSIPRAVVLVHLYGQSADVAPILAACEHHGVALIEDAAEALGAEYWGEWSEVRGQRSEVSRKAAGSGQQAEGRGRRAEVGGQRSEANGGAGGGGREAVGGNGPEGGTDAQRSALSAQRGASPGTFGRAGIFSFNGNKIITTSGGGMLVSDDEEFIRHARKLATQAREPFVHYEHTEIGYNYRMSNVLAAIGRGQLSVLAERVEARRRNFECYRQHLADLPGIDFMPEAPWGRCTRWLTCITIDPVRAGTDREKVRLALEAENIESRPVWKPMHLQPVFAKLECVVRSSESDNCRLRIAECGMGGGGDGSVSGELFDRGLCLPSGSSLAEEDLERIVRVVRGCWSGKA